MPNKKFTIEQKEPDKTCNARIWKGGAEIYCPTTTNQVRCEIHNIDKRHRQSLKDKEFTMWGDLSKVSDIMDKLKPGEETDLSKRLKRLTAVIKILEARIPVTLDSAETIGKLIKLHGELVERKIDVELKKNLIVDTDKLWHNILFVLKNELYHKLEDADLKRLVDRLEIVVNKVVEVNKARIEK